MQAPPPPPAHRLAAVLDVPAADSLLGDLQRCLARRDAMLIDGSAVERVSTACLQVLAAAAAAARSDGLVFTTAAPSDVLREAITNLGLGDVLAVAAG